MKALMVVCLELSCRRNPLMCFSCSKELHEGHVTELIGDFVKEPASMRYDSRLQRLATTYADNAKRHRIELVKFCD